MRRDGKLKYTIFVLISYLMIWIPVAAFIKYTPDKYISNWTISIPGSGVGASVNLDSIGQASSMVASPYAHASVDPKVNYKALMFSRPVLKRAADKMGMEMSEIGKPKISSPDQTSLMSFTVSDSTAEGAKKRAQSFYEAFEEELDRLRQDEYRIRREGNLDSIREYQENVDKAQRDLLEFQSRSRVVTSDQFTNLAETIEALEARKNDLEVLITGYKAAESGIRVSMGVDEVEAGTLLRLVSDPILKSYHEGISQAKRELVEASSVWGAKHPKVVLARSKISEFRGAIRHRTGEIAGDTEPEIGKAMPVTSSGQSEELLSALIVKHTDRIAAESELTEIVKQLDEYDKRMKETATQTAQLESLERSHQVASTIFISALAKMDLGRSDMYASYPMTQLTVPPNLPWKAEKLHKVFAVLGGLGGSVFVTFALVVLWQRKALLQITLKRN